MRYSEPNSLEVPILSLCKSELLIFRLDALEKIRFVCRTGKRLCGKG